MNYKVQPTGTWKLDTLTNAHFLYQVIETATQNVVKSNLSNLEAKALCRHLNFGGGFDGWTPPFFLEKIVISEDNG